MIQVCFHKRAFACMLGLTVLASAMARDVDVAPLANAHAHNDYNHARPLLDALAHGFGSVEADVFLKDGRLLIGHTALELRPERTLEKLYLTPLRERARTNGGRVYPGWKRPFFLLIDIKTEAKTTYAALDKALAGYADILSATIENKFEPKAVVVIISGNRPVEMMTEQKVRYAGIDGRLSDLDSKAPPDLLPWISDRWGAHFRWQGKGDMPANERAKLRLLVVKAHQKGRQVRFWATPEDEAVWKELRAAGVDLINTDQLARLQRFLLSQEK